jgi:gliding motility-associated-like protein
MKTIYFKISALLLFLSLFSGIFAMGGGGGGGWGSGPRKTSLFLAGAELKVRPLNVAPKTDPNTRDTVEIRLIYYRDCEANPGTSYTFPTVTDTMIGMIYSKSKCEFLKFACWFRADLSDRYATPICPYNSFDTKCETANSARIGYRTEVFADTVVLPYNADDWVIGMMYSNAALTTTMDWYTRKYGGTPSRQCALSQIQAPPTGFGVPRGMNPPSPFSVRIAGINMRTFGQDATESYFYIEAEYSNAIPCGFFPGGNPPIQKYCANTTPNSAGTPFIFICENRQRLFNLGYFDDDGHTLAFEKSTPMKAACFGDPACGQPDRSIEYLNFAGIYNESNPLGPASTYIMDPATGELDITMLPPGAPKTGVGKYKAAVKITETDPRSGVIAGKVYRDFTITVIADEECEADNSLTESSFFIPGSAHNFQNCALVPGRTDLIEACNGTNIKFSVRAFSLTNLPNAALVITGELSNGILNTGGYISSQYINNTFPTFDTAIGTLNWNIPANTPPGIYPVIFQIRDCVNGYILSRSVVYRVRINKRNRIDWGYLNFTPQGTKAVFSLDPTSRRAFHCGSPLPLVLSAASVENDAIIAWRSYKGNSTTTGTLENSEPNSDNWDPAQADPTSNYVVEMVTNQYCNNRDTVLLISKSPITPTLQSKLPDSCFNAKGQLEVGGLSASAALTCMYDWQSLNSEYDVTPSFLSNTADIRLVKKDNTYICYVISQDTCLYPVSVELTMSGIKPRGQFVTDRQYACPGDTINVFNVLLTTSICSPRVEFSKEKANSNLTFAYPGTQSNTNPTPKVFTASATIDRGRTALLYKGTELCVLGMKPGIVKELAFYIDGVNDPNIYNNVDIWMRCTDRFDLQNGQFEDTFSMRKMFSASNKSLSVGWNDFDIADFVWDGKSNLYFEVWTSCNKPCNNPVATSPAYLDNLTNYVSIIGKYGISAGTFETSGVVTSNSRHNIKFKYSELLENIQLDWNQKPFTYYDGERNIPYVSNLVSKSGGNPFKSLQPSIVSSYPVVYNVKMTNGACSDSTSVLAQIDTNYKVKVTPKLATKCPGDTVHTSTERRVLAPRPLNLNCGPIVSGALCSKPIVDPNNTGGTRDDVNGVTGGYGNKEEDSCRVRDSIFFPRIGNATTTDGAGNVNPSPFGGGAGGVGALITDKRIQILYPFSELKNILGMKPGYIRELAFEIVQPFVNTNKMLNFAIRMKCAPNSQDSFVNSNFESLATFEEVFYREEITTVFGWNRFALDKGKEYAWDGKSGIIIDICFDNFTGYDYRSERVRATTQTRRRCLSQSARTTGTQAEVFGCNFLTGALDLVRPNIEFTICKATRTPPPIPREIFWAPFDFISNTLVPNPIIYNQFTTKYYTILDYVDTTYGKNKVICRVRDTMNSIVDRPTITFDPPIAVACEGQSVTVSAGVLGMNQNLYTYEWDTTQFGKVKADYTSPVQIIRPPNPGYHYVKVRSANNPNCYNIDSIWVDIQKLKTMPDLGAAALICPGDSVLLSIPNNVGYKKPRWKFAGQIIDTGYSLKVATPGAYSMIIDSGACTNISLDKWIVLRKKDTASLLNLLATICEGDSALVGYNQGDDIANPIWNTGATTPYIKVNQPGIYFLVNPRDQYGCLMHMRDSATVSVISNPDFKLIDDTICMSNNQKITLQPVPYDPKAQYTWFPDGRKLPYLDVYTPGIYRVLRDINGCQKEATALVVNDTAGRIILGKNQAVCCDEVITLDANPEGRKYKGYLWSSGQRSQVIYTAPNVSGLYVVEAIKPNGCKDTGSIFIDSKCGQVRAKPDREVIYIGEENKIQGEHLLITATNITYKWIPTSDTINKLRFKDSLSPIAIARDTGDIEYVLVMTVTDSNYMPPKEPCVENEVVRFKTLKNQMDTVNIFTPDGDGINDYFYPRVQGVIEFKEFKIYNRYGQLLHDDAKKPWDGKFNGEYQPVGVYVSFISYELNEARKDKQTKYDKIIVTLVR